MHRYDWAFKMLISLFRFMTPTFLQNLFKTATKPTETVKVEKVVTEACGDVDSDDDEEMEQEEMFVEAYETFKHKTMEWGGPRRGGRLPEPTRYGDWERKGRCTDF